MTPPYPIVTIAGVGLLGASLGLALKNRELAGHVRGVGRRQSSLDTAMNKGAIDSATTNLPEACADSDIIVLCTPAAQIPDQLDVVRTTMKPDAVVTDAASTKSIICNHARATWPSPSRFVGAHPMAGSEKFGPDAARDDLYDGAYCIVCADGAVPAAVDSVHEFWKSVGCTTVTMDAADHDRITARTSHVPHVVAAAIAKIAAQLENVAPMVGSGFRDTTRIAAGRPELWRDICLTNPEAIIDGLNLIEKECAAVRDAIQREDADALIEFFETGQRARQDLAGP